MSATCSSCWPSRCAELDTGTRARAADGRPLAEAAAGAARGERLYDGRIYGWLRSALGFGLRHRISSILLALGLVALSAWGYGFMRQGFFPDMVYDQLYMEYKLPEGTNSTRVAEDLHEIETWLKPAPRSAR